ncbi:MAG: SMP-30/gluconolactonase/LRE family protein, partial [Alphaproteobacteria bacterium]|nr:SMP-30/gluconolactonase/LRE family protein [Alphaproteobacteria bacterium]
MLRGEISCIADIRARVTESPFWDPRTRQLRFVAIYDGAIHTIDWSSTARSAFTIPAPVGSIAPTTDGRLVCGLADSVALVDPRSGALETVARVTHAAPNCRLNDGRCDPAGRFWVGSMIESLDAKVGALYRIDGAGSVLRLADGLICSNGLAWSPDGRTMYHADSRQKSVWRYDYDPATGEARDRRLFFMTRDGEGRPDGAAVDEE